jgi:hypothetical protein
MVGVWLSGLYSFIVVTHNSFACCQTNMLENLWDIYLGNHIWNWIMLFFMFLYYARFISIDITDKNLVNFK